jgi:hypothetical protein
VSTPNADLVLVKLGKLHREVEKRPDTVRHIQRENQKLNSELDALVHWLDAAWEAE